MHWQSPRRQRLQYAIMIGWGCKITRHLEIIILFASIVSGNVAASLGMSHCCAAGASSYVNLGFGVPTGLIVGGLTWFILSRLWAIYSNRRMQRATRMNRR
jgi:hypothetical protein